MTTRSTLLYYRNQLDPHDQSIYDRLLQQWMYMEDEITLPVPHENLTVIAKAIHYDHPILFYVDYYTLEYFINPVSIRLKGRYLYTRDQTRRYLKRCEQWGQYLRQNIPAGLDLPRQALWLHDAILANTRYGETDEVRSHNLIGVIEDGEAVCEGIAMTYKFLCDLANIPCIFVAGTMYGCPHGWNMLWVKDTSALVDVTNDITRPGRYSHRYFLRNPAELKHYVRESK